MYVMSISNRGALPIKESNSKQPHQKHPLPNPKNLGGGNFKKYAKRFSGGARPPLGGQAVRLIHSSAGTGFARKCKIAPMKTFQTIQA